MLFIISIIFSVICFTMIFLCPYEYASIIKNFNSKKQLSVSITINSLFLIAIVIIGICLPNYYIICCLLSLAQLFFDVIYISVLRMVGENTFRQRTIDEILKLYIDITDDPIEIRRKLMENSDLSYSIKDIEIAVKTIKNANVNSKVKK